MKSKGSKNSTPGSSTKSLVIFVILLGGGYAAYKYFFQTDRGVTREAPKVRRLAPRDETPIQYPENSPYKSDGTARTEKKETIKPPKKTGNVAEIQKVIEQRKLAQQQLRESFKSELQIKAKLPENLHYATLDLDEGVAGIRGTGKGPIEDLTILATKKRVDEKSIANFLNSKDNGVPVARGLRFDSKPVLTLKAPAGKGLGKITILESNNPRVKAAYIPRSDGRGSYLFILDAETALYESNEGLLDNLLEHLEAQ